MAKNIQLEINRQVYEVRLVDGVVRKDRHYENELYTYCYDYFWSHYKIMFFADDNTASEIFQNSFVAFWDKIERHKIYSQDKKIFVKGKKALDGSILSYFMGIARIKYLEWAREHPVYADPGTEIGRIVNEKGMDAFSHLDDLYGTDDDVMYEIVSDLISHMQSRCNEILTKYYYERKDYDTILKEIPSIKTKDALKTRKYKCLEDLRNSAKEIYHRYINS